MLDLQGVVDVEPERLAQIDHRTGERPCDRGPTPPAWALGVHERVPHDAGDRGPNLRIRCDDVGDDERLVTFELLDGFTRAHRAVPAVDADMGLALFEHTGAQRLLG